MPAGGMSQKAKALSQGNAMSFAPSMSGTRKLPNAPHIGMIHRKIMMVPWSVKSVLYCWPSPMTSSAGVSNSVRMSIARMPPIRKNTMAVTPYCTAIIL